MDPPPKIPGWGWVKIRSGMHGTFIHVEEENDEEEESQSNLANKTHFVGGPTSEQGFLQERSKFP
jgi:hypothetical protein